MSLLAAGAILGAGALSSAAAMQNNAANIQFQRESNDSSIQLANTAHQREVRDLIAAGINPVLTAGGSGASVPQLGTPSLDNPGRGLADAVGSAASLRLQSKMADGQLNSMALQNAYQEQLNEYQGMMNSATELRLEADKKDAETDSLRADLEHHAMENFLGINRSWDPSSKKNVVEWDQEKYKQARDLAVEGIQSDMKVKANANWRSNLSSFMPFVSPVANHSAAGMFNRRPAPNFYNLRGVHL